MDYAATINCLSGELGVQSTCIKKKPSPDLLVENTWLCPDLVGMKDLSVNWRKEIKDRAPSDKKIQLWAFKMESVIDRSNIYEVFYQTLSSSAWANFGYLVINEIEDVDTFEEMCRLSGMHGVGVIRVDQESASCQIISQAKERPDIDWNILNRLTENNPDLLPYIYPA